MKRLLTALIVIPPLVLYIMKLSSHWYAGILITATIVAQYEFYSMYRVKGGLKALCLILGIVSMLVYYLTDYLPQTLIGIIILVLSFRLFQKKEPESALNDIAPALIGLFYIPLLMSPQMDIRRQGPEWIILLYGAIWTADGMAYFMGKSFGKRKLYESISPKKTIEGAVASVFGGVIGASVLYLPLGLKGGLFKILLGGALLGLISILGDLVESMFKRDAGVKDSGVFLPGGHGGMLDKLDAALFAGPVFYLYMVVTGIAIR